MESGAVQGGDGNASGALKKAKDVGKHFKCNDDHGWLDCLRKVDAHTFNSQANLGYSNLGIITGTEFLPHTESQTWNTNTYSRGNTRKSHGYPRGYFLYLLRFLLGLRENKETCTITLSYFFSLFN